MIQIPTMTAPLQQPALVPACPMPKPAEFNAINISINGARVDAPAQPVYNPVQQPVVKTDEQPTLPVDFSSQPAPQQTGGKIDYTA